MRCSCRMHVRAVVFLLLVWCMVLSLSGCADRTPREFDNRLNLLSTSGVSIFRVVCSQDSYPPEIVSAAEQIRSVMAQALDTEVSVVDDYDSVTAPDLVLPYEILVGETARKESQEILSTLGPDEWVVRMVGHKIVILGETNRATLAAVDHFLRDVLGYTGTTVPVNRELKIDPDYNVSGRYEAVMLANGVEDGVLPGAPYGASILYLASIPENSSDALSLATLQGLAAARTGEHILLRDGAYENYLSYLEVNGLVVSPSDDDGDDWTFATLLARYRNKLDGYILCSSSPTSESSCVAVSLAHHLNAVVVTEENVQVAEDLGMECVIDVTDKNDVWLRASRYFALMDKELAVAQSVTDAPALLDYAVMTGCYCYCYNGNDAYLFAQKFKFLENGAVVLVGDGAQNTGRMSALSDIALQPVDARSLSNMSTLSGFLFTASYLGKDDEPVEQVQNVQTVCIVLSDCAELNWMMDDFTTDTKWYGSEQRGNFAVNWVVNSLLYDIASPLLTYLGNTATEEDDFVLTPSVLDLAALQSALHSGTACSIGDLVQKMMLHFVQLSTDFDSSLIENVALESAVQGILYAGRLPDSLENGDIQWISGKPVVSMRYRMTASTVDGTPNAIASALNEASTNVRSSDGYSLVVVDVTAGLDEDGNYIDGGDTMAAVAALVEQLDEDVDVVTVSEFMARIKKNLK